VKSGLRAQLQQHQDQHGQHDDADAERAIRAPEGGRAGEPGRRVRGALHGGTSFPPEYSGLAQDLAAALDPVQLAVRGGFRPDPWQAACLRSAAPQLVLNCSRQSGKSSVAAWLAVYTALYAAPALVLVLVPALRQSQEGFRKIKDAYLALGPAALRPSEESALRLALPNGSRIVCLPGAESRIRGYSGVALLIVDEASRVPDALYFSVRPMLAVSQGRIVLLSTPFGRRGFFHDVWEHGEGWERTEIPADQCPRIDPAWLAQERASIPDWWYQQEYHCAFLDAQDAVFRTDDIDQAFDPEVLPLWA
jgi:hypothetical protein